MCGARELVRKNRWIRNYETNDILMILISIILCGVSIYILIRIKKKE